MEHILRHYLTPTESLLQQYLDFSNVAWICGQFSQAIEASKALYAFTLQQYGDAGYKPAFAARAVAGAYLNAGDDKSAEPYYYLTLEHMLKKPEESYKELGCIYQKVGRCAYSTGDYTQAENYLNCSLEAYETARQDPKENMTVISHVDTYVDLCRMHMAQGNYTQALSYSQTAYDILYSWKNCEVTSSAYCLCDMGNCYSQMGEYEKAEEYLNRALALNIHFNEESQYGHGPHQGIYRRSPGQAGPYPGSSQRVCCPDAGNGKEFRQ